MTDRGYERLFWGVALALFLFHLLYIWLTPLDLSPDEAYYWDWSRRLAFGYYSKPPMVAWIIALCTRLGSDSPFFVRLGATILSLGGGLALFYLGKAMFGARVGFWASLLANATPGYAVGSVIMTIDPPLMFFWGATTWLLWLAVKRRKGVYWYLAGVCLGFGLLSKYTMVAIIPSFFIYLTLSPSARPWLRKKEPYLFVLIGLFILSPNLYWNYLHHWPAIKQPVELIDKKKLDSFTTFIWFFGPQAGILSPLTFLLVLLGLWVGGKRGLRQREDRYLFLFWHAIVLLAFFIMLSFFSVCYVNWAAPAYFAAFILAAAAVWEGDWSLKLKKRILMSALIVGIASCSLLFTMDQLQSAIVKLGLDIPAEKFPTNRLKGWRVLGRVVGSLLDEFGRENTFVISYKRDYVSEVAFYAKGNPKVYTLNLSGVPESQYDLWEGYEKRIGQNAFYITKIGRQPPALLLASFKTVKEIKRVEIYDRGELIHGYSIFFCRGFMGMVKGARNP